jgi:hypothetical protein
MYIIYHISNFKNTNQIIIDLITTYVTTNQSHYLTFILSIIWIVFKIHVHIEVNQTSMVSVTLYKLLLVVRFVKVKLLMHE